MIVAWENIQIIHHSCTNRFRTRTSKCGDNVAPKQRLEGLRQRTPQVGRAQQQRRKDEYRPLAEVIRHGHPEEIEQAEHQDGPDEQRAGFRLRLVELEAEDVKGGSQAADGEVGEEGEGAYGSEADVLLGARPAERIVGIVRVGHGVEDEVAIFGRGVQLHRAVRGVYVLERAHIEDIVLVLWRPRERPYERRRGGRRGLVINKK